MVKIIDNITKDLLIDFQNSKPINIIIIIKFGATWCKPCQDIKKYCSQEVNNLPDIINYIDIDIDKCSDLYRALKTKKMIKGVPTILAYFGGNRESNTWYIPNDSVSGNNIQAISSFFQRCINHVNIK